MINRLFAIAVSSGILLFQAVEMVSPTSGWYWPFLDYPMYSIPHAKGEVYLDYALWVRSCGPDGEIRHLDNQAMGMRYFELHERLSQAAEVDTRWDPSQVSWARARLSEVARNSTEGELCTAEVRVQRHHMEEGVGHLASDWETAMTWSLDPSGTDSSAPLGRGGR